MASIARLLGVGYFGETQETVSNIEVAINALVYERDNLRNELELSRLALAKREPEPETYTIGGSSE